MFRQIALTVAFAFAVPTAALACHDREQTKQANTTTDGQQIVLAQADAPKKKAPVGKEKPAAEKAPPAKKPPAPKAAAA